MNIDDRIKQLEEELQSVSERLSDVRATHSIKHDILSTTHEDTIVAAPVNNDILHYSGGDWQKTDSPSLDDLTIVTPVNIYALSHNSFADFIADKHIDHTAVSVIAGTGLSGGGNIAADKTINLSHLGIQILADPGADRIMFWDETADAMKWLSLGNSLNIALTVMNTIQDIRTAASPQFAGLTMTGNIIMPDGGTIGLAGGPLINFDDTNKYLEITGCNVGIKIAAPTADLHIYKNMADSSQNKMLYIHADDADVSSPQRVYGLYSYLYPSGTGYADQKVTGIYSEVRAIAGNYPAIFMGGFVGIGVVAPDSLLHIEGGELTVQGAAGTSSINMKDADGNLDGRVYGSALAVGFQDADTNWTVRCEKDVSVQLRVNNQIGFQLGLDRHIDIYDWDDAVLKEVSFGPDDSCEAGFKCLRVPN